MAELKTKPTDQNVEAFLNQVEDEKKRADSFAILELFKQVSGEKAQMWGTSIVGFGSYHYKYSSGQEGDWPLTGFSPRKQNLTLYIMRGFDQFDTLLAKLGKFKTGKGCLYIKKIEDVDQEVLKEMVRLSIEHMRITYPG
ncbi:MAG: hypothetical protein CVU39_01030 [Chloroflexi bacterium HGW-Chloroflexi-10]|nr:MAG: hypothetical protein CVU39_01030 [Chloroflexi bacterium HGW-Chloroflexi-10]